MKTKLSLVRPLKYPSIDGIRTYAALSVFFEHVLGGLVTEYFRIPIPEFNYQTKSFGLHVMAYFQDGNQGVDVFFIISGFLMARIVLDQSRKFSYSTFIESRFKRIYPAFLVSLVLVTMGDCLIFGWPWKAVEFLKNLVFLNSIPGAVSVPYNGVSWSLGYEFAFYIFIPILLLFAKFFDRRIAAFFLLCVTFALMPSNYIRMLGLFVGAFIGAFDDTALRKLARSLPLWILLAAFLLCGIAKAWLAPVYLHYYFSFLLIASALFIKLVWDERGIAYRFLVCKIMRSLGTLSYSIYLFHAIIASIVLYHLTPKTPSIVGAMWYVALTSAMTVLVAYLSYLIIERWYFARFSRRERDYPVI